MRHRIYSRYQAEKRKKRIIATSIIGGALAVLGAVFLFVDPFDMFAFSKSESASAQAQEQSAEPIEQTPLSTAQSSPEQTPNPTATPTLAPTQTPEETPEETPVPTPTQTPEPEVPDENITLSVSPENDTYDVSLELVANNRFRGTMRINYTNKSADTLYELKFRLYPNIFDPAVTDNATPGAYYEVAGGGENLLVAAVTIDDTLTPHAFQLGGEILQVPLYKGLEAGENVSIHMDFNLDVPARDDRFGRTETGYSMGSALPVVCKYENGEFDTRKRIAWGDPTYSDVMDYKIALTAPVGYDFFASSGRFMEQSTGSGKVTHYAEANDVRSFAFTISNAEDMYIAEQLKDGVLIRSYAETQNRADSALQYAVNALDVYADMLSPYPYSAFTVVQGNLSDAGIAYTGMIQIDDPMYRNDSELEETIARETAYMWLGSLVGSDEYGAPWIDESLARYLSIVYYERSDSADRFLRIVDRETDGTAAATYPIDGAMSIYSTEEAFSEAVHMRGAYMYHSLRETIGDDAFFEGLKLYVEDNAFEIATSSDIIAAFESASSKELDPWFETMLAPIS